MANDPNPSLTRCPDCGQSVSRRAEVCPNCGCPFTARERSRSEPPPPSNSGGSGCLVAGLVIAGLVAAALFGLAFLHQNEGGKVFGPGGVVAPPATKPLPPPQVTGLSADWDAGAFSHDLMLTNNSGRDLLEVEVTIKFYKTNGQTPDVKQFWGAWQQGEVKRVNVTADQYQKVAVTGTASERYGGGKGVIDESWTWTWSRR